MGLARIALGSDGVDLGAASVKGSRDMGGQGDPSWGSQSARAGDPSPPSWGSQSAELGIPVRADWDPQLGPLSLRA